MTPSASAAATALDPILVYGAPRSGTTYLRQILDAHPEVTLTNEVRLFTWLHESVAVQPHDDRVVFEQRADFIAHLQRRVPEVVRSFYSRQGRMTRWWGDKNPHYAQDPAILRTVATLFPQARFVHIHRDPRAVLGSLLQKRHDDGRPWISSEDAHMLIVAHVQNALAFGRELGDSRVYSLRYEDLVRDDVGEARRLFGWLGIPWVEPVEDLCRAQATGRTAFSAPTSDLRRAGVTAEAIAQWRKVIPPNRLRDSLQYLAPVLLELGYEDAASLDAANRALPD